MHSPVLRQWLFEKGADIYHINKHKETLLFKAIKAASLDALDWLLEHGLDITHCNRHQQTLLHVAVNQYQILHDRNAALLMIKKLVAAGVELNARNSAGETALVIQKPMN